jgi:putative transposase
LGSLSGLPPPQEYITPYTSEQNGLIECFFRTLKEESVCQHNFASFTDARREVLGSIAWYNSRRPHAALGRRSPAEFRAQQLTRVA